MSIISFVPMRRATSGSQSFTGRSWSSLLSCPRQPEPPQNEPPQPHVYSVPPSVSAAVWKSPQLTAETRPLVRDRTFKCLFEWLRTPQSEAAVAEHFDQVQAVVVAGLTDVWSAIRKACAQRLHGLERNLKQEQLMQLYASCVTICQRPEGPSATWQAKEGALMGL